MSLFLSGMNGFIHIRKLNHAAILACLLCGCAAHKRGSPGRVVLENDCIRSINVTPKTYCDKPVEGGSFSCHEATVTYEKSCGPKLVVNPKSEKRKPK